MEPRYWFEFESWKRILTVPGFEKRFPIEDADVLIAFFMSTALAADEIVESNVGTIVMASARLPIATATKIIVAIGIER